MKLDDYVNAAIQISHRHRCLILGCYYGLLREDACVYCGHPKHAAPVLGVSPIAALQQATGPPASSAALDRARADLRRTSTRAYDSSS